MDGQALHLQFVTWKATTDLVTPKSVQNTDLDTAWVCLSELNGNTSTFCKARSADFLYGKPRYLGVACTDDHRSYRGVLKNHPHPRRNACVGGRGDKYRCCWWLKFCIIWYGQDHVNSGTYHHPQSQIYVFFFFEDVFDIRFEMCQALGSVPFFGPHGLGGVGDDHFFCEWWTLFSRVCDSLYLLMI